MEPSSAEDAIIAEFEKLFREHGFSLTLHPSGEEGEPRWVGTILGPEGGLGAAVAGFGSSRLAAAESAWHAFLEARLKLDRSHP